MRASLTSCRLAGLEEAAEGLSTVWQKLALSLYTGPITRGCSKSDTGAAMWKGATALGFHEAGLNQGAFMVLPFLSKEVAAAEKQVIALHAPVAARPSPHAARAI